MTADPPRSLLEPLTDNQQQFVELVGEVYAAKPGTWPVFDYVQRVLDMERIDAIETFESFPNLRVHSGEYRAIWSYGGARNWPRPGDPIALTIAGIHHCKALGGRFPRSMLIPEIDLPEAFIALVRWAASLRRETPPSPTEVRNVEVTNSDVLNALIDRYRFDQLPPRLLFDLMDKEPPFWGSGGSIDADGNTWRRTLSRLVLAYEDVTDTETYVERLRLQQPPVPAPPPAAPSPFNLVAALDYLSTVWELEFGNRLFQYHSAESVAKLSLAAPTREEFDAHASALTDLLRQADAGLAPGPPRGQGGKKREHPLTRFEAHLLDRLGPGPEDAIRRHIAVLEAILFVREAGQHSAAGRRGAAAMIDLGTGFPPADWQSAWATIERQAIEALNAIRDELQAHRAAASSQDTD